MKSVAILGCGYIAGDADDSGNRRHIYTHAKAISKHDQVKISVCCDVDADKLNAFANRWNVPKKYQDIHEMLSNEKIDILVVSTPTIHHFDNISQALEHNIKAIFCEKPLAENFEKSLEVTEKAKKSRVILAVNFMRRWDEIYQECKDLLYGGELGRIETIVCYVDTALFMNSIHMLDLIVFFGGDILSLVGQLDRLNKPRTVHGKIDYGGFAFLKHKNGIISFIKASGESRRNHFFELDFQCTKGRLRILDDDRKYEVYKFAECEEKKWLSELRLEKTIYNEDKHERVIEAYNNIIDCIENGSAVKSSGYESIKAMEIIEMIYQSDKKGNLPVYSTV